MTIPASSIVTVNPAVIGTGGSPLSLNGVVLDTSELIPTGKVLTFTSADAVADYFGLSSTHKDLADIYFLGYSDSYIKPGKLYIAPYADSGRSAWLMSAAGLTLGAVKALEAGTLTIIIDGTEDTTASIDLSGSSSLSDAASTIQAALQATGFNGVACEWNSTVGRFIITSSTTGQSSTISYASGALASGLYLTQANAATLSQGVAADTPETAMANIVANATNWATFMTSWEPDTADKLEFAEWCNEQNQRFAYVAWDSDANACVADQESTFASQVNTLEYDGIIPISGDPVYCMGKGSTLAAVTLNVAAFVCGMIASIDFSRTNARITGAFKSQSGLAISCADEQKAENLMDNGYNFYGSYATANDGFVFFYNGQLSGKWKWIDPYVNQIYMNNQFQLALMTLLTAVGSVPYTESGYALIRAALQDPIQQMLKFGGIRAGVEMSELQKAEVNQVAGVMIDRTIEQDGFYLQVLDPGAQVRGNRGTPVCNFWYTDGGSVHKITLASIDVM